MGPCETLLCGGQQRKWLLPYMRIFGVTDISPLAIILAPKQANFTLSNFDNVDQVLLQLQEMLAILAQVIIGVADGYRGVFLY